MNKFSAVALRHEFRHKCGEHELLLDFHQDQASEVFQDWWGSEGSVLFMAWLEGQEELKHLAK